MRVRVEHAGIDMVQKVDVWLAPNAEVVVINNILKFDH